MAAAQPGIRVQTKRGDPTIEEQKKSGGQWKTVLFVLLNIAVIVYLAIREFGGETPARFTGELRIVYLLPAVGCFLAMLVSEAWKYAMLLRRAGHKHAVRMGLDCAVIGKYFDNVTPAGFGGQPFQIYYLNKHGCSDGVSGSLPILGFLGLQLSFVLLALAVRLFGDSCLPDSVTLRLAAWIGIALYAFFPLCILLFAAAPGPLERIVHRGTKVLGRLHIIKQPDESAARAIDSLRAYTGYLKSYRKQPFLLFQTLLLSLVFRLAMVIMPWFVLRAFGADIGFMSCVCQVTFIYAAVTVIPTPGNSGVAEASFYAVFSSLAPGSVFWAMLVWRLLCYYSWLLSGAGYFIAEGLRRRYFAKKGVHGDPNTAAPRIDVFYPHGDGFAAEENSAAMADRIARRGRKTYADLAEAGKRKR